MKLDMEFTDKLGLHIQNLTAGYRNLVVIRAVSIDVQPGETVGLVGLNGSGKSTILNAIMGITWGHADRFTLDGRSLKNLSIHQRKSAGLSIALQRGAVFHNLTIAENLQLAGMETYGLEQMFYTEALLKIARRLATNKNQVTGTLSGGEQRLLGVAMAISQTHSLFLVDEPSLGLESDAANEMLQYVANIPKRYTKSGVLVVSHDYVTLAKLCNRLYALRQGSIYCTWDPVQLEACSESIAEVIGGKVMD